LLPAHVNTIRVLSHVGASPRIAERFSVWTSDMVDHVIAPSEKIKELLERYGVRRPVTVVHNGIEVERFQNSEPGYLHSLLGLPPSARILLVVGRLTQEKNVAFLVRVLARIQQTHKNVYLVPVGQGGLRATLQNQAARLGVGEYLRFTGPLPPADMPRVYADADLYLSASFSEAHSMAALEALASGLPLVVVPDQSLTMMVRDGENGFVVGLDEAAFAGAILAILENPGLRESMRACSIKLSYEFSVQAQARKLVKLYGEVIAEKRLQRETVH
jgi:1,2-diacylglycerol 3-alpha-glucosyltransferase